MTTSIERVTAAFMEYTPIVDHHMVGSNDELAVWKVGIGPGSWLSSMDADHEATEEEIKDAVASMQRQWPQPPHVEGSQPTRKRHTGEKGSIHFIGPKQDAT
ncbi:MAG: hypothetical protein PGN22_02670 [Agrobacterium cavarae]